MYAIIDIETTGTSSQTGKVTEIAIFLHDGVKITGHFSSLINPECRIPYRITSITGINDEMVANAPRFYQIAKQIVEMTEGHIFVAHNVNFDYNFIRNEFRSLGYDYKRKKLCTVQLSRKLLPGFSSYSLGKLCANLGIVIENRHRASGDALATVKLFERLLSADIENEIPGSAALRLDNLVLHPHLNREMIRQLPTDTGVYYFYDENKQLIYIGKSVNIRSRVLSHLSNDTLSRAIEMKNRIAHIQTAVTGSELLALLKESEEIKKYRPFYNRAQRRSGSNNGIYAEFDALGYIRLSIGKAKAGEDPLTPFGSAREARDYLNWVVDKFGLCQKLSGLSKSQGACFYYTLHQCSGACVGEETPASYNERAQQAINSMSLQHQNLLIIDKGRKEGEKAVVSIENGRYAGFGYSVVPPMEEHIESLRSCIEPFRDNRDVRQIIRGFLNRKKAEKVIVF